LKPKPIHRRMPHLPQIGTQKRHPVLGGAAGQRQLKQVGRAGAAGLGGVLRAAGDQLGQRFGARPQLSF